jgi:Ca2+-binding RTX toxin-like protein
MVDLKAGKKFAINTKSLKELSSDVLLNETFQIKQSNKDQVIVESGKYKVILESDSSDEFSNFKEIIPSLPLLPLNGTVDNVRVEKGGKKLYTLKNADIEINDLLTKVFIEQASANELAAYIFDGDDSLCGSNKKDNLYGFAGNDTIKSKKGKDKVWGGEDDDIFYFNEFGKKHFDRVKDYDDGVNDPDQDSIELGKKFVKHLGSELTADEFVVGEKATAGKAQMIYDDASGNLWFDVDGTGSKGAKLVAKLGKSLAIDDGDFLMG